jgi:prophage regulatory protein
VQTITPAPTPTKILRKPAVVERVGLSATTIWRLTRAKKFPPPVRLSENTVGWYEHDIEGWLQARTSLRDVPTRVSPNLLGRPKTNARKKGRITRASRRRA